MQGNSLLTFTPSHEVLYQAQKLRLGVVGKPSDWLIASTVNYADVLELMNIEIVDIPIEQVTSLGEVDPGMKGAEAIYHRLKEIVEQYDLQGVTLRCFDLLKTVMNTGCIALSKLNDEGIPAACEGDIPTLLTMMIVKRITGELCFQVNPARVQADGKMLFAHCTLPLGMTEKHEYTTHFESGIGVAIHGDLPTGDYTLLKMSGDMQRMIAVDVTLERCQFEPHLCRTQVWVQATPEVSNYFIFNGQKIEGYIGNFDTGEDETAMIRNRLQEIVFDDYDLLIQLCDAVAGAGGVMDIVDRMSDVKQRYGHYDQEKWDTNLALKAYFENRMGKDLYDAVEKGRFSPKGG